MGLMVLIISAVVSRPAGDLQVGAKREVGLFHRKRRNRWVFLGAFWRSIKAVSLLIAVLVGVGTLLLAVYAVFLLF